MHINFFIFVFGKKDVYVCVISRFYPVRISLEKKVLTLNVNIPNISVTMYFHKCFLHQIMEYVVNHFYFAGFAINLIYLSWNHWWPFLMTCYYWVLFTVTKARSFLHTLTQCEWTQQFTNKPSQIARLLRSRSSLVAGTVTTAIL